MEDILTTLQDEEGAEKQLISLYLTLLDAGVENCLPENMRPEFKRKLNVVQKESEKHKRLIDGLLAKYRTI